MSRCLEPLSKGVAPRLGSEAVAFTRRWFTTTDTFSRGGPCGISADPSHGRGQQDRRPVASRPSTSNSALSGTPTDQFKPAAGCPKAVASARPQCMAMPRTPDPSAASGSQRDAVGERPVSSATTASERVIAPATSRAPIRASGYAGQSSRYRTRRYAYPVDKRIPFLFLLRYQVKWLIDPSIPRLIRAHARRLP